MPRPVLSSTRHTDSEFMIRELHSSSDRRQNQLQIKSLRKPKDTAEFRSSNFIAIDGHQGVFVHSIFHYDTQALILFLN